MSSVAFEHAYGIECIYQLLENRICVQMCAKLICIVREKRARTVEICEWKLHRWERKREKENEERCSIKCIATKEIEFTRNRYTLNTNPFTEALLQKWICTQSTVERTLRVILSVVCVCESIFTSYRIV